MIKLIYTVPIQQKAAELEWLNDQKIYPALEEGWDWTTEKPILRIGMIVSPETAIVVKLRHNIKLIAEYRQR